MADNLTLNPGADGATLATDDVGGVHYQIVKIAHGALDAVDGVVDNASPLPVDIVATTAPGIEKAEDSAHSTGDEGMMVLAVRRDADTSLVDTDGDYAPLQVNAGGQLKTEVVESALPSGAATAANQTTIIGHVDGLESLLTTIDADTSTLAGAVTGTEMQVDVVAALPAGDNNIGNVDIASAIPAGTNNIGDVDVLTIAAGANLIGNVGIGVRTSGGATPVQFLDVDETEDEVKGSAGQLYFIHAMNLANAKRYLKVYDETAATCDVGTDTPKFTFPLPTQGDTNGAGFTICFPMGIAFANGICIAATTGFAVADTGAPGANEIIVNVAYA